MSERLIAANNAYYKYCTAMLTHGDAIDYLRDWQLLAAKLTKIESAHHERFCIYTYKRHIGTLP